MKNLLRIKTSRLYTVSKVVYIVLLSISVIVDATLAISLYELLVNYLGPGWTRLIILFLSLALGAFLYCLYMSQLEYLTKNEK